MDNCNKCINDKKCILHIEKSDYQTDFNKVGFLNEFYEELFNYAVDFEGIKKFVKKEIEEDYSDDKKTYEKAINFLNDKDKFKKFIKKYFEEDDLYDKYFDNELNVVKNTEDNELNSSVHSIIFSFDEYFKNKTMIFTQIFFPTHDDRDDFNYMKIIRKFKKIHFNYCKFNATYLELKDIKVFFQDCEFMDSYSISNSDILENQSNIIYQKCIFHKDVSISKDDENYKINHTLFSDCQFKKDLKIEEIEFENGVFNNTAYNEFLDINICELRNCTINDKFILEKYKIKRLDLSESVFNNKVKIQNCNIDEANFYNTIFNNLADFNSTIFNKSEIIFNKTTFQSMSVFTKVIFKKDINFQYTTFGKLAQFKETIFEEKFNLEDAIIREEVNFLNVKTKNSNELEIGNISNRETARIIKHSFEKLNNIIEANKFYVFEMEKRKEELSEDIEKGKNIFQWVIFNLHKYSSNHSTNPLLTLFWILVISLCYSYSFDFLEKQDLYIKCFENRYLQSWIYRYKELFNFFLLISCILSFFLIVSLICYQGHTGQVILFGIFSIIFYIFLTKDFYFYLVTKNFNPFSIMTNGENLTLSMFVYKSAMAYLIYQFIISVRQNTRRK